MKWMVSLHSKQPLGGLLSLRNLCKTWNFLASRAILSSGMLSYCSSEAAAKEDRANSKADETVLVELASWPPIRALVTLTVMSAEQDLVKRKDTMMPLVDFQEKKHTGWRKLKIPSSRVVRCLSNMCYMVMDI
jgi:uncharacterized sporulation protein YeaH/YhbH (DUF444 family)